ETEAASASASSINVARRKSLRRKGGRVLIVMDRNAAPGDVERVVAVAGRRGLKAHPIPGAQRTAIGLTGNQGAIDSTAFEILPEAREATGLPVVTEVLDTSSLDLVARWADCLQIGARNMQNFELLKRAGQAGKPVLLKRGMSATLEEFLLAAEYLMAEGNPN